MSQITNEEVLTLMFKRGLTVEQAIDVVVDVNGFIGVGLISLGDQFKKYCYKHKEERVTTGTRIELLQTLKQLEQKQKGA